MRIMSQAVNYVPRLGIEVPVIISSRLRFDGTSIEQVLVTSTSTSSALRFPDDGFALNRNGVIHNLAFDTAMRSIADSDAAARYAVFGLVRQGFDALIDTEDAKSGFYEEPLGIRDGQMFELIQTDIVLELKCNSMWDVIESELEFMDSKMVALSKKLQLASGAIVAVKLGESIGVLRLRHCTSEGVSARLFSVIPFELRAGYCLHFPRITRTGNAQGNLLGIVLS